MWLCSQLGFFSIVRKEPETFHIRARCREDLEQLVKAAGAGSPVASFKGSDYPWRILCRADELPAFMQALTASIDYGKLTPSRLTLVSPFGQRAAVCLGSPCWLVRAPRSARPPGSVPQSVSVRATHLGSTPSPTSPPDRPNCLVFNKLATPSSGVQAAGSRSWIVGARQPPSIWSGGFWLGNLGAVLGRLQEGIERRSLPSDVSPPLMLF